MAGHARRVRLTFGVLACVAAATSLSVLPAVTAGGGPGSDAPPPVPPGEGTSSTGVAGAVPAATTPPSTTTTTDGTGTGSPAGGSPSGPASQVASGTATASHLVPVGSAPSVPAGATPVAPLPASTTMQVDVVLRPRDQSALDRFVESVSDPSSPHYGDYLAPGEFADRFGPSTAAIAAARDALSTDGLAVGQPSADGLLLPVSGTAGQLSRALHVGIEQYRLAGGRTGFAGTSAPELPADAAAGVVGVTGLSDLVKATPLLAPQDATPAARTATTGTGTSGTGTGTSEPATSGSAGPRATCPEVTSLAGATGSYTWTTLASTYGFTTAYDAGLLGQDETIALFELADYPPADLFTFERCFTLPAGEHYGTVTGVPVDGGSGAATTGQVEAALDLEDVLGLAPEADVLIYSARNGSTADLVAEYDAMVTQDRAQVISTSWGLCEPEQDQTVAAAENEIFEEAAAQGQTVLAAAGDSGSEDCHTTTAAEKIPADTTLLAVDDPASQPYVTAVGGTDLEAAGATAPIETAWDTTPGATPVRVQGGGGGVSSWWAKPSWQATGRTTSGVPAPGPTAGGACSEAPGTATTTTSCRQVPDVSASADPTHGDVVYCAGATRTSRPPGCSGWAVYGGTSAAAPLWAALTALADEEAGTPVGFLDPRLYALGTADPGVYHEVTTGTNDATGLHPGKYDATTGYNDATGWGSPSGALLAALSPTTVSAPSVNLTTATVGTSGVTYTVHFTTSASGTLEPGDTIALTAPAGTVLPSTAADYGITGSTGAPLATVTPASTGTSGTGSIATIVLGSAATVGASTGVTVTIRTVTNATVAGTHQKLTVRTTTDEGGASALYNLVAGPPSGSVSTLSSSATTATVGQPVIVVASITDQYGNRLGGRDVTLSASSGTVTGGQTAEHTTSTTGQATFSVTASSPVTATYTATISSGTVTVDDTVQVRYRSHVTDGVEVTVDPTSAGASATATVTFATSTVGALVPASTITLTGPAGTVWPTTPADYDLSAPTGATATVATATVAPDGDQVVLTVGTGSVPAAADVVLTARTVENPTRATTSDTLSLSTSADTEPVTSAQYTVTAAASSAAGSTVTVSSPTAPAGGTVTVTVTDRDVYENPEPGHVVTLTATAASQAAVTPPSATTSATGVATFTVRAAVAASVTLTATDTTTGVVLSRSDPSIAFVAPSPAAPASGYDLVGADGGVFVFSPPGTTGGFYGSLPGLGVTPTAPVVGMVPTVSDQGYFLVGADGGVFAFGTAPYLGSLPGDHVVPSAPVTGIVAADTDKGYFLVGRDGGVFAFGTVPYLGSLPGEGVLVDDVIGIAATPTGDGYWLVTATGTVYAFGAAEHLGTARGTGSPVSAIAGTPTGGGYWITTQSGAVDAFGNARPFGTLPALGVVPALAVIGIVHTAGTGGYWLIGADGGIFAFGDAGYVGSLPGLGVHVTDVVGAVPTEG